MPAVVEGLLVLWKFSRLTSIVDGLEVHRTVDLSTDILSVDPIRQSEKSDVQRLQHCQLLLLWIEIRV